MVRIGGGWETLEEFLVRNDPCRNKGMNNGGGDGSTRRRESLGAFNRSQSYSARTSAQSTPSTPCAHTLGHPLLQRPMSTPPTTGQLRAPRTRPSFSACSTPTQRSEHSSRSSLLI